MKKLILSSLFTVVAASTSGCDLDVPDLNAPGIDELQNNPTRASVSAAATGLIFGHRVNVAAANGYVVQLGILGREAYNFDGADPRYIGELLAGTLQKGSPFGGAFWAPPYANIRMANIVLGAIDKVTGYSEAEKAGLRGFANTMIALDLLRIIITHEDTGAPIDVDKPFDPEVVLGPWATEAEVYARIISLLDSANMELGNAGAMFSFPLPAGFTNEALPARGFNTPAAFRQFNRAMRARVALYQKDWDGVVDALDDSFIIESPVGQSDLDYGPSFVFTQATGDTPNLMVNPNIYAHPKLETQAERNAGTIDRRFTRKVTLVEERSNLDLTSKHQFSLYPTRSTPVPIIRNEELILMLAEAQYNLRSEGTNRTDAITNLNTIRTISGGLAPLNVAATDAEILEQIQYNRRYSLMFEGGHRWIDIRRFKLPATDPVDPTKSILDLPAHKLNLRYPIPQGECDARPGEAACMVTSDAPSID